MPNWKVHSIDRVPMRPSRLALILGREESWLSEAQRRQRAMMEEHFAATVANCAELAAYKARAGQDQEMRDTLARVELEIQEADLGMALAKADLRGEPLAKKLAELDRKRQAAEARIGDLNDGIKLFIGDVERDRKAAHTALARLGNEVGLQAYMAARVQFDAAKAALATAIAPYLDSMAELMQAIRPPMDGAYGQLADRALAGTLSVEASSPPETAPSAEDDVDGGNGAIDENEESEASLQPGEASPPPPTVPIAETPGEATTKTARKYRLETQTAT